MNIAILPLSNHIQSLRAFISRMRRLRTLPSQQELTHADDSLNAIEQALNKTRLKTG